MGNISLIEFIVYGFITYSSLLMLIISVIKDVPTTRSLSILRSIFLLPGMICAGILSSSGVNITLINTANTIKDLNTTDTWTEATTTQIVLQNPVWITVHYMILIVLLVYVIAQILSLFGKKD